MSLRPRRRLARRSPFFRPRALGWQQQRSCLARPWLGVAAVLAASSMSLPALMCGLYTGSSVTRILASTTVFPSASGAVSCTDAPSYETSATVPSSVSTWSAGGWDLNSSRDATHALNVSAFVMGDLTGLYCPRPMPSARALVETLPDGCVPSVDAPWGSKVAYVDRALCVRVVEVGERGRFLPGFLVPGVSPDTEALLMGCLRAELPGAGEVRVLRQGGRFFMCAVRTA